MRHRTRLFGLLLVAAAMIAASACSNQGEGDRCDKNSGDSDCAGGLICTTITGKNSCTSTQGELPCSICCPPQGQSATTAACSAVNSGFDAGPSTAADGAAGAGGAGGADGAAGAAADAGLGGSGGGSGADGAAGSSPDASLLDASMEAGG